MDVWDTQIRTGNQYDEKWLYIRQNPVRRGLVKVADDWRSGGRRSAAAALTRGAEGAAPSKGAPAHKKRKTSFCLPPDLRISEADGEAEDFLLLAVNLPGLQVDAHGHAD